MKQESGNALWFILLAIALLAALAVTISRSSDTTEQSGDIERMRIQASDIMRTALGIEKAIDQMRMRSVGERDISFENSFVSGYTNPRCPTAGMDCRIFDVGGGGITYKNPPGRTTTNNSDWLFTGANSVQDVGTNGTGTTSNTDNEILIILPNVTQALCGRMNTELGISGIPQNTGNVDITTLYTGGFIDGQIIDQPAGKRSGCFEGSGIPPVGSYHFYHTLIVR